MSLEERRKNHLLAQRRDVLVHPETDDSYQDHTAHALWLGPALPLRVEVLRRGRQN